MKNSILSKVLFEKNESSFLKPLLKKLIVIMTALNLLFYAGSLLWGFDLKMLLGFLLGFAYVVWCYIYVAKTVECAVDMTLKRAKRSMTVCYAVRYAGLFLLCLTAMQFKFFNIIGIIIPQFYPRIALSIITLWERKTFRKD